MSTPTPSATRPRGARFPAWLRKRVAAGGHKGRVEQSLSGQQLHTVCEEARCPNRGECFGAGTATFLVLGAVCSRNCAFCGIAHGTPAGPPDADEPRRVAEAADALGLDYVVVTSVTRDDLPDGGAGHFAEVVTALKRGRADRRVEVLIPDFGGNENSLAVVLDSGPDVLNHNIETVARLYPLVRPQADYRRSLGILEAASRRGWAAVKSGMMVGLGERDDEVVQTLADLRKAGCTMVTIGQYLRPGPEQVPVGSFVEPAAFEAYARSGEDMGVSQVVAGPFVRSSYRAREVAGRCASMVRDENGT